MSGSQHQLKITEEHQSRRAIVYLRQSSSKQVEENLESQRLQYGMADRARDLGFQHVETIDCDLGSSASLGAAPRKGFDYVISAVARGEVGIVLSREVSRLSRTDRDWCHLLEVCQIFGTLIGDEQQVYDLSSLDDQLVLGIKGTLSVVELKVLKMRMLRGQEEKARRGELFKRLPSGYVLNAQGKAVKSPDQRVREAIELVHSKFRQLWSVRQTFQWLRDHDVLLPVNPARGGKGLTWQIPTQPFVRDILVNPFYAGAYVWGRRPMETILVDGRVKKRQGRLRRPEECRVFIPDHDDGYIDWETYEENQRIIRGNSMKWESDESVAAVRDGQGLLTGLLRCGRCGRKLHVRYWGKRGTAPRYLCPGDFASGGDYCLGFGGGQVDRRFSQEISRAISPLGIEASLKAIERLTSWKDDRRDALVRQLEQLEYEAARAFEQYNEVDARNRLVAAELEQRWNTKLEEIIATDADESTLHFVVHWKGGVHTELTMQRPLPAIGQKTSMEVLEIVRRMTVRYGDGQIASVLNRLGHRTGKGKRWNQIRVQTARRNHSIAGQRRAIPNPEILSLSQAAEYCGVSHKTIERLVQRGILKMEQVTPRAPWEIRRCDLNTEPVQSILEHLRNTGKLLLEGGGLAGQMSLFAEKKGDDNARHHE